MIPILSRFMHGLLTDYPYVLIVGLIGPGLVGAKGTPLTVFHAAALFILVLSLLTRAEWGLIRVVPYRVHLIMDVVGGVAVLSSPWLFGFADQPGPRWFAVVMGLFGIGAGTLSKTDEMPANASTIA